MENLEMPQSSSENTEVRKDGGVLDKSQQAKPGKPSRTKRKSERKSAKKETKKETKKEVSGIKIISVEDQACKDLYLEILKDLESQHFVHEFPDKLKDPGSECDGSPFYCELCAVKMTNIEECQNHVRTKAHKKLKKSKGEYMSLSRVSPPSEPQILALNRLLDSVFLEHGLCPVKDLPKRQEVAFDVVRTVHSTHPECSVSVYGSSFTGFGLKESDVNLDLVIPEEINVPHVLLSILDLLKKDEHYCDVKSEFDAKVPRILFKHVSSGLDCELSPGNGTASKTSYLLKMYSDLDARVRTLVAGLRYWARICSIDCQSEGGLPGYSLALMVIQFLQETKPPVLPRWTPEDVFDKDNPCMPDDFISDNKDEIGSLWFQLFRFYCFDFEIPIMVVSIREPMPLKREDKKWGHRRIAIEDPFSTKRNVASSLSSDKVFEYFSTCWKNSFFYFGSLPSSPKKEPVTEQSKCTKKPDKQKHEANLVNEEEAIFEMDDLDQLTKQMQCMELSSVDGAQSKGVTQNPTGKDSPSLKSKGDSDTDDEVEIIILSDSDSEEASKPRNQTGSREKGCHTAVNNTSVVDVQDIHYRFDAQIFRGKNRPVKTCCYCKEDGHTKVQCPDLRKPPLRTLPLMTQQFSDVLDYACKTCRADFQFEKLEVAYRETVLRSLETYIHEIFPGARLHLFGSSKNGFGFRSSDIDICMTLDDHAKDETGTMLVSCRGRVPAVDVITNLAKHLKKHKDCANVLAITTAKVPIVKFYLRSCKREADISLYNTLALENTAMLATYAQLDDRVTTLGYTVKVFAKVCDIGDASKGSLSSYAYILMLLHYLQQCNPPLIPVLQSLYTDKKQPEKIIDGWNCWFCRDPNKIKSLWNQKEKNPHSAGLLWYGFLRYYTEEFDFENDVVCCRRTKKLTKFEKMWTKHVFAIEDPFNLDHNLGAGVTRKMASYIMNTFIRGRERFGIPRYDIPIHMCQRFFFDVYYLTDGYEAPTDRNCRVCNKIGHIARDCPRSKANRRAEEKKEAEERKAARENTEKVDAGMKSFNTGPAPNKQGQNTGAKNSTSVPTAQPNKLQSPQEGNAASLSRSQPDSQFVAPPVKDGQSVKHIEDNLENAPGMPLSKEPNALSHVQNPLTGLTDKNVASAGLRGGITDPNMTQNMQPTIPRASSAALTNETGYSTGVLGNKLVDSLPGVRSPGSSNSDSVGNQYNAAVSATVQTPSSVPLLHYQRATNIPNHPQDMKPPPGFFIPEVTGQVPHATSTRSPHTMAGTMSPPVNVSPADRFEGQPILMNTPLRHQSDVTGQVPHATSTRSPHTMAGTMSPPVNVSPADRFEGQPILMNTSPRHQPGMFSPQSGQFVGSPSQQEMWLRQQGLMMLNHPLSPPVRPLVPYPMSPEVQVQSQLRQWRGASDILPMEHVSSPVRGQQHLAEHNHQMVPRSPPNISRNVMWPEVGNSPPYVARGQQLQGHQLHFPHVRSPGIPAPPIGSPARMTHPHVSHGNSHGVLGSPQQIAQQLQYVHSPGMPPPVIGSPPQQTLQQPVPHQGGLVQPAFGTHMTGEQFINFMRVVEDETKKSENVLPTKVSSNEFEPKELKPITTKDLKVAETPEEHKLLSKLSKVKSLWEGNASPELDSSCSNRDSMETGHVTLQEQSDMGPSTPDTKLPIKREAWGVVSHEDNGNNDVEMVLADQEEREKTACNTQKSLPSSITDENVKSSEAPNRPDFPSSAGCVVSDEALQASSNKGDEKHQQTSVKQEPTAPTPGALPKQTPTRRGGRGRKHKATKHNEADKHALEKDGEKAMRDGQIKAKGNKHRGQYQENYDDFKVDALKASPSAKKPRGEGRHGDTQNFGTGAESRPRQTYKEKDSPTSAKDGDKKRPEGSKQEGTGKADTGNSLGISSKGGKGGTPKQKDSPTSAKDGDKKGPEGNKRGAHSAGDSPGSSSKGAKGGAPKQKDYPTSAKDGDKKGPEWNKRGAHSAGDSPGSSSKGAKGGAPKQKDYPTSAKDGDKKGPERNKQGAHSADSGTSPGSSSKGSKGGAPKRKDSPTSAKDGDKKGAEGNKQSARTTNPGKSPGDSSKGGKGRAPSRGRRRRQSRTTSEGPGGEKDETRNRSNSAPEKHPSKNS